MKKCLLLIFCMLSMAFLVKAQSFNTNIFIKKSDCDTMNGSIKVTTNIPLDSFTYSWSNGSTLDSINNLSPGTYYVTVTHYTSLGILIDAIIDTVNLTFANVSISISAINNPTCGANNGSIITTITGGSGSYTLSTVKSGVNYGGGFSLPTGLFQVVALDNFTGCSSDSTPVILRDTGGYFYLQDTIIHDIDCFNDTNGSIVVNINGGLKPYRYTWIGLTTIDSTLINLGKGLYTVQITDSLCPTTIRTFTFEVKGPADSLRLFASSINDTCYRKVGKISLSSTGGNNGINYYWTDGTLFSGIADSLNSGVYNVVVIDSKGCTDSLKINIGNDGGPSAFLQLLDSTCIGTSNGAIRVKVTTKDRPHHFTWSHNNTLDTNLVTNLAAGIYSVTITNNNNCDTVMSIQVANFLMPSIDLLGDTTILQGQSTFLTGIIDPFFIDSIYWLPQNNLVNLNTSASVYPNNTTEYRWYVVLKNGCTLYDSALVQVDSIPIEVRIPNVFTPNNDGINDLFKITTNEAVRNIELHIYDRWGNNVFDSYDKFNFWDGINKYTQTPCDNGVYTYYIYIDTFINKNRIIKEGNISLIK